MSDMWTSVTVELPNFLTEQPNDDVIAALKTAFEAVWNEHAEHAVDWLVSLDGVFSAGQANDGAMQITLEASTKYEISGASTAARTLSAMFPDAQVRITEEWTGDGGPSIETVHYQAGRVAEQTALEPVTRDADGNVPTPLGHDVHVDDHADEAGAWVRVEIPSDPDEYGRSTTLAMAELTATEARALSSALLKAANGAEFHYARLEKERG